MKIYFFPFIYCLLFTFSSIAQTQTKQVEILHANTLEHDEGLGKDVQRLIGDVRLKDGNTLLYCDSAYKYPDNNIDAFGNVRIQQGDSLTIYGQFLKYNSNTSMAEIHKNIRLIQKGTTLQTELLYYDMSSRMVNYPNGGTITSKQNVLTSDHGYYNPKTKIFSFKKNVVLTNPQYVIYCDTLNYSSENNTAYFLGPTRIKNKDNLIYCESGWYNTDNDNAQFSKNASIITPERKMAGDSIHYDRINKIGTAFGNVSITDSAQSIIVTGDRALLLEKKETSIISGHALLKQFYGSDTLFLHADTLRTVDEHPFNKKNEADTSVTWRILYAYHKVKFYRTDIQGSCDSLVYSGKDSIMRLYKQPIIWSEKNQLIARKIELKTSGGEITTMFLKEAALIVSKEDSVKYNQIKGKEMTGYFKNNKLSRIYVEGNGQTIYFAKDKEKKIGINKADCSNLIIYLKENAIEKITFLKKPDATLFPMKDFVPKEFLLKEFVWRENERPLSVADIFSK
ncbi:MAG: organic solvent tolerance protein OstA [Bacteroidetes bacterium]|nr:organic solvent tolerance protein OstA [Bacteroidota bacterium]